MHAFAIKMARSLSVPLLIVLWVVSVGDNTLGNTVHIETVSIGNPGNSPDAQRMSDGTSGYGSVAYSYRIGKYEVTNSQYIEFLNGVDPTGANTLALYSSDMTNDPLGGIIFTSGSANGSKYSVKAGRDNNPVGYVSWYDSVRFANWMNNGMGSGDTENGAYTLGPLGDGAVPLNGNNIARNPGAKWWLPSDHEWYKAAYHKNDGVTGNYWDYATSTDAIPFSDQPPGSDAPTQSNTANFFKNDGIANGYDDGYAVTGTTSFSSSQNYLTDVGAYTLSGSPYGTFDQAGNVFEWNEGLVRSSFRVLRGGWPQGNVDALHASIRNSASAWQEGDGAGYRVATIAIPEPRTLILSALAGIALLVPRRTKRWP